MKALLVLVVGALGLWEFYSIEGEDTVSAT